MAILGKLNLKPRCIWITNKVSKTHPYQGFGIHLPHVVLTDARLAQSSLHDGFIDHAQPRFSTHTKIDLTDSIPVFDPPLNPVPGNLTGPSPEAVATTFMKLANRITGPISLIGRPISSAIDGVATGPSSASNLPVHAPPSGHRRKRQTMPFAGQDHIIISPDPQHNAAELYQSATSAGLNFISFSGGLLCDIGAPFSNTTTGSMLLIIGGSPSKVYSTVAQ